MSAGGSFLSNSGMSAAKPLSVTVASRSSCKKKIEQRCFYFSAHQFLPLIGHQRDHT